MKKLLVSIFGAMTVVGLVFLNYHAIKESAPFLRRMRDKFTNSKPYTKVSGWCSRVTQSNIVQGTKTKVKDTGGRLVHMFERSEKSA